MCRTTPLQFVSYSRTARTCCCSIATDTLLGMTHLGNAARTRLPQAIALGTGALVLTLLFTGQDVARNVARGAPAGIGAALMINALDWVTWLLIAPAILIAARRCPVDGSAPLIARIGTWLGIAVVSCLTASLVTGFVALTFGLVPIPVTPGGAPPLSMLLPRWIISTTGLNLLVFLMIVAVVHAAAYYSDSRARRLRESDLQARLAQAELQVLRMQLHPHFLFNALHTVSALMLTDVAAAHRVIAAIGDLLRSSIDHTASHEVPLRREMEFVDRYLEVQQARYGGRLRVVRCVADDCLDAFVPSFVLQPLLENAVRHGVEQSSDGATIRVSASRRGSALWLEVRDDARGATRAPNAVQHHANGGLGLANIRSRLVQLYGPRQFFEAGRDGAEGFAVSLSIPFHADGALYPSASAGE